MTNSIIHAKQLSKTVQLTSGSLNILENINLEIFAGEKIAILGSSGSGKTTLLSILAGLDSQYEGDVFLLGKSLRLMSENDRALLRKNQVGFLFQNFLLIPELNVLQNVTLPMDIAGELNLKTENQAIELIKNVGLGDRLFAYPNTLSGGEQQRVAIARAFILNPKVLFVDEPTGSLDATNGKRIIGLLFELNQKFRTTIVIVTHDLEISTLCDRVLQLNNGKLI